jgi:hypothetical protein
MALDWCILGLDGAPVVTAAMEPDGHHELLSRGGHLPLLARAADYYTDAEYTPSEVRTLLDELSALGPLNDAEEKLAVLCREALHRGCGIVALAD